MFEYQVEFKELTEEEQKFLKDFQKFEQKHSKFVALAISADDPIKIEKFVRRCYRLHLRKTIPSIKFNNKENGMLNNEL